MSRHFLIFLTLIAMWAFPANSKLKFNISDEYMVTTSGTGVGGTKFVVVKAYGKDVKEAMAKAKMDAVRPQYSVVFPPEEGLRLLPRYLLTASAFIPNIPTISTGFSMKSRGNTSSLSISPTVISRAALTTYRRARGVR